MATPPWFPLYVGDYLRDTMHLTTEQHGAYMLLLMAQWTSGSIPDDNDRLAAITRLSITGWLAMRPVLLEYFSIKGGALTNNRLERERERTIGIQDKRRAAGKKGASGRWKADPKDDRSTRRDRTIRIAQAREKGRHFAQEWEALVDLCGNVCVRCNKAATLVKDHITPVYQGGSDAIENIQPLCQSCNAAKGPENEDFRPPDWRPRLNKRLANGWQTAGNHSHKEPVQGRERVVEPSSPLSTDSLGGEVVRLPLPARRTADGSGQ